MRKAYVVSPAEPSGTSWLLNCLLELDVKVGHKPCVDTVWRKSQPLPEPDYVWQESPGGYALRPKAELLKKWLPACTRRGEFTFQRAVAVDYTQDFPAPLHESHPVIYFLRDPRDAMYSMYRRVQPEMSCFDFVRFLNPRSLLSRIDHWDLHVRAWSEHPRIRFLRFEDYKRDARAVLQEALDFLGVEADGPSIAGAVNESTFERAAWAEARYRLSYPQDREIINRSGRVGDWHGRPEVSDSVSFIEKRARSLLERFGYLPPTSGAQDGGSTLPATASFLDFYRTIRIGEPSPASGDQADPTPLGAALLFAHGVNQDLLRRSRLRPDEIVTLLDSLEELLQSFGPTRERLTSVRARFAEGAPYHLERLQQLRARLKRDVTQKKNIEYFVASGDKPAEAG